MLFCKVSCQMIFVHFIGVTVLNNFKKKIKIYKCISMGHPYGGCFLAGIEMRGFFSMGIRGRDFPSPFGYHPMLMHFFFLMYPNKFLKLKLK